jgi:hypothetical protein
LPTSDLQFKVTSTGDVFADGTFYGAAFTTGSADFAEMLEPGEPSLEPGDLLCVDSVGRVVRCRARYQTDVVGVYSTSPAFLGGDARDEDGRRLNPGHVPVAIVGIVPTKATSSNGVIAPGDLLVASSVPGHVMKAGANAPQGSVVGKALARLDGERGTVQMLVTLQ